MMTNRQVALQAAATLYSGEQYRADRASDVTAFADNFYNWLERNV